MSLGNDPNRTRDYRSEEALHALAAVAEARGQLLYDGAAPTKQAILKQMGRDERGRPIPGTETLEASESARAARELLSNTEGSE